MDEQGLTEDEFAEDMICTVCKQLRDADKFYIKKHDHWCSVCLNCRRKAAQWGDNQNIGHQQGWPSKANGGASSRA